jgi:BlaI family transcriptional regulator, penicillinase repressor
MKKPASDLTPLELEIMDVLWRTGATTVQEVHREMQVKRKLAYNTVQTMLTILHRKGRVKRVADKRAYTYSAVITREKTAAQATRNLLDRLFGGNAESLVLNMVKSKQLSAEQLTELQSILAKESGDADGES